MICSAIILNNWFYIHAIYESISLLFGEWANIGFGRKLEWFKIVDALNYLENSKFILEKPQKVKWTI